MIGPTNLCFTCKNRTKNDEGWWACLFYGEIPDNQMTGGECPHYIEYKVVKPRS
jgi:hypothetical protein